MEMMRLQPLGAIRLVKDKTRREEEKTKLFKMWILAVFREETRALFVGPNKFKVASQFNGSHQSLNHEIFCYFSK